MKLSNLQKSPPIAVFDIGGTWFRSGIYSKEEGLVSLSRVPAYNYKNTVYHTQKELQLKLVDYLTEQIKVFRSNNPSIRAAAISMGAALNGHTGEILNSGPLWGPDCEKFDLLGHLLARMPEIEWRVINDVSAALLRHINEPGMTRAKRLSLITVSSGIACRTFSRQGQYIPLNEFGMQGEIGHIPINFLVLEKNIEAQCDCGGANHLNAFCSGRGIENVLDALFVIKNTFGPSIMWLEDSTQNTRHEQFYAALKSGDVFAAWVLNAITYPIAQMIVNMLTIDPKIEKVIMTGGVVHGAEKEYMNSLLMNLEAIGMYQIPDTKTFFKKIITLGIDDDNSGLLGAALAYENKSSKTV